MVREFPRTTATASTAYVIAQPRGLGSRSAVGPWVLVVLFVPFAPVITNLKKHSCKKAKNKQRKSTFCRGNLQSVNLPCFSRVLNSHGHANSTFSRLFSNNPFDLYWVYSNEANCLLDKVVKGERICHFFFSRKLLLWSLFTQGSKKYFGDEYYTFTLVGITKSCIFLLLIDCPLMVFSFLSRYFLVVNTFDNWTLSQRDKSRVFLSHALLSLLETNLKCHTRTVWGLEWAEIVYLCFEPLKGLMSAFLMLFGIAAVFLLR